MRMHFRKGSLLEYNGVYLAEGPWPGKAYFDAMRRARQRDAALYVDYGFTRPGVISRGPIPQDSAIATGGVFQAPVAGGQEGQGGEPLQIRQQETLQDVPANEVIPPPSEPLSGLSMGGVSQVGYVEPLPANAGMQPTVPLANLSQGQHPTDPIENPFPPSPPSVTNATDASSRLAEPVANPFGAPQPLPGATFLATTPYQPPAQAAAAAEAPPTSNADQSK
jgi:hypothetical protein